jgi:hypothetical protein
MPLFILVGSGVTFFHLKSLTNNLVPYVKLGKSTIHMMTEAESKISYKEFGAIRKAG